MNRTAVQKNLLKGISLLLILCLCLLCGGALAANEADGSKIESVTLSWITPDSTKTNTGAAYSDGDDTHLFLATVSDDELTMKYQVDVSFSGQNDYAPGTVTIRIPAQVWHPRTVTGGEGAADPSVLTGSLDLSVPEAPSTKGNFNWQLDGDEYVLTNTATLGATSKAMFQFTIRGIIPDEIADMSQTDEIYATCEVVTAKGTKISLDSEQNLTAQLDTIDRIPESGAVKKGKLYQSASVLDLPVGFANNLPGGQNSVGDYIYVKWEVYVNHEGNQPFTLELTDDFSKVVYDDGNGNLKDAGVTPVFLGSFPSLSVSGTTLTYAAVPESAYDDHTHDLTGIKDHYVEIWTAYAKEDMPAELQGPNGDEPRNYYIVNTAEWEMTETDKAYSGTTKSGNTVVDERLVTRASATDTQIYSPINRAFDGGVSILYKMTEDGESLQQEYPYTLNLLKAGRNADLLFCLDASDLCWDYTTPLTWNDAENRPKTQAELKGTQRDDATYGQLGWSLTVTDEGTFFNNSPDEMTSDDFCFSSIQLDKIDKFTYGPSPTYQVGWIMTDDGAYRMRNVVKGDECYYIDNTLPMPDILFEIQLDGSGTWITAGRAVWGTDGTGALTFTDLASGVTADAAAKKLNFPDNTTDFRYTAVSNCYNKTYVTESRLAGLEIHAWPTLTVKPSDAVIEAVDAAMAAMSNPSVFLKNEAGMVRAGWIGTDGKGSDLEPVNDSLARAVLTAAGYSAYLTKEATYDRNTDDDVANRLATVHYAGKLRETSNLTEMEDYLLAQENGAIPAETAGIWYDLLPEGMVPRLETVRVGGGDQITSLYTVPNYKGSERTLLVVEADLVPEPAAENGTGSDGTICDSHTLTFDAVIGYDEIEKYGEEQKNYLAFESRTEDLVDGILGTVAGERGAPDRPDRTLNSHTPDMPDDIKLLMTGLDPASDPDDARFVYAYDETRTQVNFSAISGIAKTVKDDLEGIWSQGLKDQTQVTVYEGHNYTYRLRISSAKGTVTKDIYLFDTIENYHVAADKTEDNAHIAARKDWKGDWQGAGQWRGTLNSIDLGEFVEAGAAPVLYISTVPDLQFADSDPGATQAEKDILFSTKEYDVTDTTYWTKVTLNADGVWEVPADLKGKVTAFAADISKKADGTGFSLASEEAATVYLHMTAPDDDGDDSVWNAKGAYARSGADGPIDWEAATDPANNMYAFNNTRLRCIQNEEDSTEDSTRTMIRNDYTRVGIIPEILRVNKFWVDDDNHDNSRADEFTVTLKRKQVGSAGDPETVLNAAGEPVQVTLPDASGEWTGLFEQVDIVDENGNPWQYSFTETLPDGTTLGDGTWNGYQLKWDKESKNAYSLTNKRPNETVTIEGIKTWTGDEEYLNKRPGQITLELYQDDVLVDTLTVTPDRNGNWSYSFGEWEKYKAYDPLTGALTEYVYTVKEKPVTGYFCDNSDYTHLVNEYDPYGNLEFSKTVTNVDNDAFFEFQVLLYREKTPEELTQSAPASPLNGEYACHIEEYDGTNWVKKSGSDASVTHGDVIVLSAGQKAVIENLPAGSSYRIQENPTAGFKLTAYKNDSGTIRSRVTASASFENTYHAEGSIRLTAKKQLKGEVLRQGQFSFEIADENNEVVAVAYSGTPENTQAGGVGNPIVGTAEAVFNSLKFTEADIGQTYSYTMREVFPDSSISEMTYDTNAVTVAIRIEDNGDGTLTVTAEEGGNLYTGHTFENEYSADCDVELDLKKFLEGRTLANQEFEFELYGCDADGKPTTGVLATVENDADGNVVFTSADTESLIFDQDDVSLAYELSGDEKDIATYYFLVKEKTGSDTTVKYTEEQKIFAVKVYDKRDGTLGYSVGSQYIIPAHDDVCDDCGGTGQLTSGVNSVIIFNLYKSGADTTKPDTYFTPGIHIENIEDPFGVAPRYKTKDGYNIPSYVDDFAEDDLGTDILNCICKTCHGLGVTGDLANFDLIEVDSTGTITNSAKIGIDLCPTCGGSGFDLATLDHASNAGGYYQNLIYPVYMDDIEIPWLLGYDGKIPCLISIAGYRWANRFNNFKLTYNKCTCEDGTRHYPAETDGDNELPVLTNKLKPGQLYLTKQVEGTGFDPDTFFEFTVTLTGSSVPTEVSFTSSTGSTLNPNPIPVDTDGSFKVCVKPGETLTFTNIPLGTKYTVEEQDPSGSQWTILESEGETGKLSDKKTTAAVFVNAHGSGKGNLEISKETVGATSAASTQEFTFEVTLLDRKSAPLSGTYSGIVFSTAGKATVTLAGGASLTLADLPAGTTYTVKETGDLPGWTLSDKTGDTGKIVSDETREAKFTNEYNASGVATLSIRKRLEGRDLTEDEFSFNLYKADASGNITDTTPAATLTNSAPNGDGEGIVSCTLNNLTLEGTTYYVFEETPGTDASVDYSDEKILVTLTMTDEQGAGNLTSAVTYTNLSGGENALITNTVKPGQLRLIKAADGEITDAVKDQQFEMNVSFTDAGGKTWTGEGTVKDSQGTSYTANDSVFVIPVTVGGSVTLVDIPNGTEYKVKESATPVPGWTLDANVYTGTVKTVLTDADIVEVTLTNKYDPAGEFTPVVNKTLEGATLTSDQFEFSLKDNTGKVLETVTNDAAGNVTFSALKYTLADVGDREYQITEKETNKTGYETDTAIRTLTVSVSETKTAENGLTVTYTATAPDRTKPLMFRNTYSAKADIPVTKIWRGDTGYEDQRDTVTLTLYAVDGSGNRTQVAVTRDTAAHADSLPNPWIITKAEAEANSTLEGRWYDVPLFDKDGKAYTFIVEEDGPADYMSFVSGDGKEGFTASNRFVSAVVPLNAEKTVDGETPDEDDLFVFTLTDDKGNEIETVKNRKGNVFFTDLLFTKADAGKTYTYTVKEADPVKPGYDTDTTVYTLTVKVTDNKDGTLKIVKKISNGSADADAITFENKYNPKGTLDPEAILYIDEIGQLPNADEIFDFVITDENGNTVPKKNGPDGIVDFDEIVYTLDDIGTHTYEIREKQLVNGDYVTDPVKYRIDVTVSDNGDGTLKVDKTVTKISPDGSTTKPGPDDKLIFVNLKKLKLTVYKEWQGGEESDITLYLYADGEKVEETTVVKDPETGERVEKINYKLTRSGYTYTFSQLAPLNEKNEKIVYTVKEKGMSGYLRIYSNVGDHKKETDALYDGGTVINRAVTGVKVRVVWEGFSDTDKKPPITLTLYCNGEPYAKKASGPDKNGWYTWSNLPLTVNGKDAVYYVVEEPLEGITTTYSNPALAAKDRAYNGGTIINKGLPKTGDSEHPLLWILLGLAAAGAGTGLVIAGKKKKK